MKKKNSYKKIKGIRIQLTGAFLIPVVLIIVLGILSSTKAAEAITLNYEEASKNTIRKTADYYGILFQNIDAKSKELSTDNTIRSYYDGIYADNKTKESDTYNLVAGKVRAAGNNDENIGFTALIAPYGRCVSSTGNITSDSYDKLIAAEEGAEILAAEETGVWSGRHEFMDKLLAIRTESYGISISRPVTGNSMETVGILVMDVKRESIQAPLKTIELPEGSICAFITADGREITAAGESAQSPLYNTSFYKDAIGEKAGLKEIDYNGDKYIYIYAPVENTGCMIYSLIPKSMVTALADDIKGLTYMTVIIAIIIAFAVGMILAMGIGKTIQKMNKIVEQAAEGDLTVSVETRRKDEFSVLARYLGNMFAGMKTLIRGAANVSGKILNSAETVSAASEEMVNVSKEISEVIEKMEAGLERQAADAKKCQQKMSILEDKIMTVSDGTRQINQFVDDTKEIVNRGISAVAKLDEKAKQTTLITETVIYNITELGERNAEIENFTNIINSIARQTNLLSLNASIEAARAGESGRGFNVVADEIRKLAEESMQASGKISNIVGSIVQMTEQTRNAAGQAKEIVKEQSEALSDTVETFEDITHHVEGLSGNIGDITYGVKDIEDAKNVTKAAVESITEVLQQTAATASQVQAAALNQVGASEELSKEADSLAAQSKELGESISKFKIASSEADTVSE